MKAFATFILIIVLINCTQARLSTQFLLTVRPLLLNCGNTWQISQSDMTALIGRNLSNQSQNMQCTKLCFFKAMGIMNSQGTLNVTAATIQFSQGDSLANVNHVLNICKSLVGNSACNTASLIYDCFVTNNLL